MLLSLAAFGFAVSFNSCGSVSDSYRTKLLSVLLTSRREMSEGASEMSQLAFASAVPVGLGGFSKTRSLGFRLAS